MIPLYSWLQMEGIVDPNVMTMKDTTSIYYC